MIRLLPGGNKADWPVETWRIVTTLPILQMITLLMLLSATHPHRAMKSCIGFIILVLFVVLSGCDAPNASPITPVPQDATEAMPQDHPMRDNTMPRISPNGMVGQTIGVTTVQIDYSRPFVRERKVFGELESYGNVWRTGANEATTITFSNDVMIEGQPVEAGTYGLFTIPGENEWAVILNKGADQWGAFQYKEGEDALRVTVTPESAPHQEMLTFTFENVTDTSGTAVLHWWNVRVPFDITVDTPEIMAAAAREAVGTADSWQMPYQYANYAFEHNVYLDEALAWVNRSVELEANYNNLRLKAHLQAAAGDYAGAVETGELAVAKAGERENPPGNLAELQNRIAEWKDAM